MMIKMDTISKKVAEIEASMTENAKQHFKESQLGHLRCLIRLAVEFQDYLEHGNVEIAQSIQQLPYVGLTSVEFRKHLSDATSDPFNQYDLGYVCESILSGVDSFWDLSTAYRRLDDSIKSGVKWDLVFPMEQFKALFASTFTTFVAETNFEKRCRLLLDIFKLQMIFVGVSYDWG